jgi:hypothetical protein
MSLDIVDILLPAFQCLKVKANGCNGSFQFVSNGVNETIVLLVTPNFADKKTGIEYQTGSNGAKKNDSEENLKIMLPIENDPAKTDRHRNRGQDYPEGKKESDFAAPANAHAEILARESESRQKPGAEKISAPLASLKDVSSSG